MDAELIEETEAQRVERWRALELERAGFAPDAARRIAQRPEIDLHVAVRLLEQGCPPDLALAILL